MTEGAMVECPQCNAPNTAGDTACASCGAQLAGVPLAGAPVPATAYPTLDQGSEAEARDPAGGAGAPTEGETQGDWLAQLLVASADESDLPVTTVSVAEVAQQPDLPIWLRDLPAEQGASAPHGEPVVEGDEGSLGQEPGPSVPLGTGSGRDEAGALVGLSAAPAALMDWRGDTDETERDAAVGAGLALLADELAAGDMEDGSLAVGMLGSWAGEGRGSAPQWDSASAAEALSIDGIRLDELLAEPEDDVLGQVLSDGTTLERRRALSALPGAPLPGAAVALPGLGDAPSVVTEETLLARANLLEELASRPATPRRVMPARSLVGRSDRLMRVLVPTVLVAVVVLALVAPDGFWGRLVATRLPAGYPPGPARMHDVVRRVARGDAVMVAFEYGPAEADEMDLVAAPVVRQLLAQGADISIVSTRSDGLVAARRLLRDVLNEAVGDGAVPETDPGELYSLDGYRPGNAIGVAQLLRAGDTPDLVVVFAARTGPLRWWVEQTQAMVEPPIIVSGTSAALEAAASTYLGGDAGQLGGAVSGVTGAAFYERIARSQEDGPAARRLDALAAGNLGIVALVIIGSAVSGLRGPRASGEGRT